MKIIKAEAIPFRIPLKKSFSIALGTLTHSNHVIVRMEDDEGRVSWGETTTFHSVYGYDQKSIYNVLNDHLIPAVIGLDPRDKEGLHRQMDLAIPFNLMAKCGIDLAVYDLLAQAADVPIHELIGCKKSNRIQTIAAIGIVESDEAAEMAAEYKNGGFGVIKVKVGLNAKKDLQRLKTVRAVVGDHIRIRTDANQGYDLETVLAMKDELDELKLEWIEQPLPLWDLKGLATLTKEFETPIAVDENIYTIHDVQQILSLRAADIINIKVVKCGGIYRSLQIAELCETENIPCFLGGCLETTPGTAAQCHFYAGASNLVSAVEIGGDYYVDDIATEPISMDGDCLVLPSGKGLGVQVDEEKIEKYRWLG